ncbi:MAG: 2-C-methyl-D-erythritol 4-phosphate cytidylyltransferase [Abditibacteriota bacterium]|nr:2-C-methyl-D-erythritol 4-phosphate cytidylyltransferase [Abditibacteriota bacterium]
MNVGIILAGGIGNRFKGSLPKQYCLLKGKELIYYSIDAFKEAKLIDEIVIVLNDSEYESNKETGKYDAHTVICGKSRNHSLYNALCYINEHFPDCEKVIENNAACPMIKSSLIDEYMSLLDEYDCVQTTYKITDALGSDIYKNVKREDYYLIQSPDAYRFKLLFDNYDPDSKTIHPAMQLPEESKVYNNFGFKNNIKVTYPYDILFCEILMNMD